MVETATAARLQRLCSVDQALRTDIATAAVERHGRAAVTAAIREALDAARGAIRAGGEPAGDPAAIAAQSLVLLERRSRSSLRRVFNLTGTVLHTNLGRAVLAEAAIEAAAEAMRHPIALEYDLGGGRRGERDAAVSDLLSRLTGAEDATVVNNNAAAVLLTLNTLSAGREAIVSRGELIEIGGSFRMPDIMASAGTRIVEVGTTNRTHRRDYAGAIGAETALILKVHTSNYRITGFTKEVSARDLAPLAREHGLPLVNDLGSGTLVDLRAFGLAAEPTVAQAVAEGADLVTFSGDKLLGGPQAGFIVGRRELVARINRNPMKRAMRLDKVRLAALEATLRLYQDPDRLAARLPTLRWLARDVSEIEPLARQLAGPIAAALGPGHVVEPVACRSEVGSGALPEETVASAGIAIRPAAEEGLGRQLALLARRFRSLPIPVIGRIANQSLIFDLRCMDDMDGFIANLSFLPGIGE
jgi:L-seryl-tRNA(Ser) seleniumtransferase